MQAVKLTQTHTNTHTCATTVVKTKYKLQYGKGINLVVVVYEQLHDDVAELDVHNGCHGFFFRTHQ